MKNQQVIIFGEVLFDCFPDGNVILGGAPFNVAWHLQAFGVSPLFISAVGNDDYGKMITEAMIDWGMSLSGIQTSSDYPTGVVTVKFINNEPSYDIVENSAYDFIEYSSLPELTKNSILYHGSLALRNQTSATTLENIKTNLKPSIFLDVNLRNPFWDKETIKSLFKETSWLKLNQDELSLIVDDDGSINDKVEHLFSTFPLQGITVTQGKSGAVSFQPNQIKQGIVPSQATKVIDTVGAGDAFSSVLLLGILKDWKLSTTLTRAQEFASAIVGIQGATIKNKSFYETFLTKWS